MNLDQFEFFNVGELTPINGTNGAVRLSRYPSKLEPHYKLDGGKMVSRTSTGCEIRFVPDCSNFIIRISTPDNARVHLYQGDFWTNGTYELESGKIHELSWDRVERLLKLPDEVKADCHFSPEVIRFVVVSGTVYLHDIDTYGFPCRKPRAEELPAKRWLAWGSSITHADTNGYTFEAARHLGVDLLGKGLSGSCGATPKVAEWLVNENDWDFASCEWGVNMRGNTTAEEFKKRVTASLDIFLQRGKPVFLITVFPNDGHIGLASGTQGERQDEFNDCLRELYESRKDTHPNLHLIEGKDVLKKWNWLAGDLVHPTHQGHARMGEQLAGIIRRSIEL